MLKAGDKIIMTQKDYTVDEYGILLTYKVGSVWELAEDPHPGGIIYTLKDPRCEDGTGLVYVDRCEPYTKKETLYVVIDTETWVNVAIAHTETRAVEQAFTQDTYFATKEDFYEQAFNSRYNLEKWVKTNGSYVKEGNNDEF